jgi:hypothetical protein
MRVCNGVCVCVRERERDRERERERVLACEGERDCLLRVSQCVESESNGYWSG